MAQASTTSFNPTVKVIPVANDALLPQRANPDDVGLDLYAYLPDEKAVIIPSGATRLISAGVYIEVPRTHFGFVVPRSGRSAKRDFIIPNSPGTLDPGYQGELLVLQQNIGPGALAIDPYEKFAQVVFIKAEHPDVVEVSSFEEETQRGTKGFGSSDNNPNSII